VRNAFASEVTALANEDPRVVMLSGDIGNRLFDNFKKQHPKRFFNCGVAEANMVGLAAGLALSGFRPVAYTITPFITARCFEQIKVDVCYHHAPVVLVGVGAGLAYASLGATHHSCEDIGLMRLLPGMTILCPGDSVEVKQALRAALKSDGPVYIRIGKKGEPVVHAQPPEFKIGKGIVVRPGQDACILSTGNLLPVAVAASEELKKRGVSCQVVSLHTVKPLDEALLQDAFGRFAVVATLEEHSRLGGLGGGVAEWLTDQPSKSGRLLRLGVEDEFLHKACDQDTAREEFGLTPTAIAGRISDALPAARK
jgi:transketolase